MKNRNKESTRYYSEAQENSVCKALGAKRQANSGAAKFGKGDVILEEASLLVECKTTMSAKDSVSVKKEWIEKNKLEAFQMRMSNTAVAINFEPGGKNYYLIDENLMEFLVEELKKCRNF